jgi:hypothetical protein
MESFLNALWLVIALALALVWSVRWLPAIRAEHQRGRALRSGVALVCVCILLFFPISLTDDLYFMLLPVPETKPSWVAIQCGDAGHAGAGAGSDPQVQEMAPPASLTPARPFLSWQFVPVSVSCRGAMHCTPDHRRAPPFAPVFI